MYNIIPLILILFSLGVIFYIISRKFSVLANVDLESIKAEQEAIFKEQIISSRLKRNFVKWGSRLTIAFRLANGKSTIFIKWLSKKLNELRDNYKNEEIILSGDKEPKIKELFSEAEENLKEENFAASEKKLVEIIGLDSQNIDAFKKLGELYLENKSYEEAKQTFKHILKIGKDESEQEKSKIYFNLALIGRAENNLIEAVENMKEALKIEPNSPRYLDSMLEISIIKKDKVLALDAYKRLGDINPDNQKLKNFKEQIGQL